jgi:hypothetical protein
MITKTETRKAKTKERVSKPSLGKVLRDRRKYSN